MRVNRWLRVMSGIAFVMHLALAIYLLNAPVRPNVPSDQILYGIIPPRGYAAVVGLAAGLLLAGAARWGRLMHPGWAIAAFFWFAVTAATAYTTARAPSQGGQLGTILFGYILSFHIAKLFVPLYEPAPPPGGRRVRR